MYKVKFPILCQVLWTNNTEPEMQQLCQQAADP